jgi:hypothetical protein
VDTFYAGRLKDFSSEWQKITEDENCHIEFNEDLALPSHE